MKYRVLWSLYAEQRLEQVLQNALDPLAITAAARQIDRILLVAPAAFGESRYDTVRIGFARPLGIHFEVMEDVRTVVVYDVWQIDR
jgi:hypothetical protein